MEKLKFYKDIYLDLYYFKRDLYKRITTVRKIIVVITRRIVKTFYLLIINISNYNSL